MTSPAPSAASTSTESTVLSYALVGNPNCGKTTLFNALTGLKQKVGNYPGVTVEKKEGECFGQHGERIRLIDLPGAYSLNARSPDEAVTRDVLLGRRSDTPRPDRVICVLDASNLDRNLYLATQVLELGIPVLIVLNMIDIAEQKGLRIDPEKLSAALGAPVVSMQASSKRGLTELRIAMSREHVQASELKIQLPDELKTALQESRAGLCKLGVLGGNESLLEPLYLLSDHDPTHYGFQNTDFSEIIKQRESLNKEFPGWEDRLVGSRYDSIHEITQQCVTHPDAENATLTDKLDSYLLHPLLGWLAMIAIMGTIFLLIFQYAGIPMDWIDGAFASMAEWVQSTMPEGDLRDLIADGIIAGVGGVVIFLPQILILFFFIGLMEDSGYMARIAFMMDRLMGKVGLNGKSFLPLLSSYACAIPGVMAARTIENPKDRLITILVTPLASCSARLPVYLLMIATIVPSEQVPVVTKILYMFAMYFLGTAGAFFFAWVFKRTIMKSDTSPMILELPSYKLPSLRSVALHMWDRTKIFIRRAGTIILGISIILWFAATFPKSDSDDPSVQLANSFAGKVGHVIEPVIKPMGYDWKVGIGLIASFAAREVFVSTMSIIYSVEEAEDESLLPLRDRLLAETRPDGSPMYTPLLCLSLMVFYVFAMQCMSTIAIVKRETNGWKWPLFQVAYMTGAAYVAATLVFQIGGLMGFQ